MGVYGNKVAFVSYSEDHTLVGIIIEHNLIARTMESWFDMVWEAGKRGS
jgi:hypothetical protein